MAGLEGSADKEKHLNPSSRGPAVGKGVRSRQ